jgi:hypothetical protein
MDKERRSYEDSEDYVAEIPRLAGHGKTIGRLLRGPLALLAFIGRALHFACARTLVMSLECLVALREAFWCHCWMLRCSCFERGGQQTDKATEGSTQSRPNKGVEKEGGEGERCRTRHRVYNWKRRRAVIVVRLESVAAAQRWQGCRGRCGTLRQIWTGLGHGRRDQSSATPSSSFSTWNYPFAHCCIVLLASIDCCWPLTTRFAHASAAFIFAQRHYFQLFIRYNTHQPLTTPPPQPQPQSRALPHHVVLRL